MILELLKTEYINLLNNYDEVKITEFVKKISNVDDEDVIDFHYQLLINKGHESFMFIRGCFDEHKDLGKLFLLKKLKTEKNIDLKAEALFILASMYSLNEEEKNLCLSVAKKFIQNKDDYTTQYYGIIVLGWIGNHQEINILSNELYDNLNLELRGYASSSFRQLWYNNKRLKKKILEIYAKSLVHEDIDMVNRTTIACVQDILKKKIGMRELMDGRILGDLDKAKLKALKEIDKVLNK